MNFQNFSHRSIRDLPLISFHCPPSNLKFHFHPLDSLRDIRLISSPPHRWDSSQSLVHWCESVPPLVH
jgi:hypothetical protein